MFASSVISSCVATDVCTHVHVLLHSLTALDNILHVN